jgi:hypothetical protein
MSRLKKYFSNLTDFKSLFGKNEGQPFVIAFLFFICSTGIVTSHFYFVCMLLTIMYYKRNVQMDTSFTIMKIIVFLSILNEAIGLLFNDHLVMNSALEFIPYSALILFTMYTSKMIDDRIFKWLVFFIVIDIGCAFFQRIIGVNSFFASTTTEMGNVLFYDMSVNGFHVNSAGLGESVFFGLLLYERYPNCRFIKGVLFYPLICAGAFLCFNRTLMVALVVFFILKAIKERKKYILFIIGLLLFIFVISNKFLMDLIFMQFFRGADSLDIGNAVSERDIVYPYYWNFAKDNFLFGNSSFKYYVEVFKDGRQFHAHNSYLQTLANNGFIISTLYFFIILKNIRKDNYYLILPVLIFSCFQTFILWGLSLGDLIFYNILLKNKEKHNNEEIP